MKRLFFVRHGETEMNVSGQLSGQIDTPLTGNGKLQAQATARQVKLELPPIDLILCSPYSRTIDTAIFIADQIGYSVEQIEINQLFAERSFGKLEGTIADTFLADHTYRQLDEVEQAETIEQLQLRADEAWRYIRSKPQENILLVGHGSFGRALRRAANKLPYTNEYEEYSPISNAAIIELTV